MKEGTEIGMWKAKPFLPLQYNLTSLKICCLKDGHGAEDR